MFVEECLYLVVEVVIDFDTLLVVLGVGVGGLRLVVDDDELFFVFEDLDAAEHDDVVLVLLEECLLPELACILLLSLMLEYIWLELEAIEVDQLLEQLDHLQCEEVVLDLLLLPGDPLVGSTGYGLELVHLLQNVLYHKLLDLLHLLRTDRIFFI